MSSYPLKRTQEIQVICLEMLCELDQMCKEAEIPYSLAGGTLLGAIRHEGFIPWDDDIDIFMLRKDYERFMEKYYNVELKNPYYRIMDGRDNDTGIAFARMLDLRTKASHKRSAAFTNLWIDILPLDVIPEKPSERDSFICKMRALRKKRLFYSAPPMTGTTLWKKLIKTPVTILCRKAGFPKKIYRQISSVAQTYENSSFHEAAEIVAQAAIKGTVNKTTFHQSVLVPFEGHMFCAMPDYNHYLTGQYGNYLILPPKNKRKAAHRIKVSINLDQYSNEIKEKILYYSNKKDIEETNQMELEQLYEWRKQQKMEPDNESFSENFTENELSE